MKSLIALALFSALAGSVYAQKITCVFKKPYITIHFGKGDNIKDPNTAGYNYSRVQNYCPQDGHYSFISRTSDCFGGDWHTIREDHTAGDDEGNMLVVNSAYRPGKFFSTPVKGLKSNTIYEFGVWMMNVCIPSEKCPYPLLPDITMRLQDEQGKIVMQIASGEIVRTESPVWKQFRGIFTAPENGGEIMLTMLNSVPGGCGNDFALDDITFRECFKVNTVAARPTPTPEKNSGIAAVKPAAPTGTNKRSNAPTSPVKKPVVKAPSKQPETKAIEKADIPVRSSEIPSAKKPINVLPPPPKILTLRANPLVKQIDFEAGEISVDLYDNGEIDGDTVSIYHNNVLIVSKARLSQEPISFRIRINPDQPHHEIIMVAENLGSIPPNTSVMIIRAGDKKHEVFISSSEQKNARVVFELKE